MKNPTRHLFSAVAFAAFFLMAVASGNDDKDKEKEVKEQETKAPAQQVTVQQLAADYEANEIAADQKYKDKPVVVTGTVTDISKDVMGDIYVVMTDGDEMSMIGVQCFFSDDHTADAAKLTKGQKATIKGMCDGKVMHVILRGSSLQ